MLSHTHRLCRISNVHRVSFGKFCGTSSNTVSKSGLFKNQVYRKNTVSWMQLRASSFGRNNASGGKGLVSQTTPVKKESAITLKRIAFAVKLVRFPFLLVAISTIGYQKGGTFIASYCLRQVTKLAFSQPFMASFSFSHRCNPQPTEIAAGII